MKHAGKRQIPFLSLMEGETISEIPYGLQCRALLEGPICVSSSPGELETSALTPCQGAEMPDGSRRNVSHAKQVCDHGIPERQAAARPGQVSVSTAPGSGYSRDAFCLWVFLDAIEKEALDAFKSNHDISFYIILIDIISYHMI